LKNKRDIGTGVKFFRRFAKSTCAKAENAGAPVTKDLSILEEFAEQMEEVNPVERSQRFIEAVAPSYTAKTKGSIGKQSSRKGDLLLDRVNLNLRNCRAA